MKIVLKPVRGRIQGADIMKTSEDTLDRDMTSLIHFMQKHYGMRVTKAAPYVYDVSRLIGEDYYMVGIICLED